MAFWKKRETRRTIRPAIEALEGRAVPATFHAATVKQLLVDVALVNNTPGPNIIRLAPGAYRLTSELQIQDAGDLTIVGSAQSGQSVAIYGAAGSRVMEVDGGNVTLLGVSIEGGNSVAQGAGIDAENANLTLQRSFVSFNSAKQLGGGIYADGGTLVVANSTFTGNEIGGGESGFGGSIAASNANVTVVSSTIRSGGVFTSAAATGGSALSEGGAIFTSGGMLRIAGSTIQSNTATAGTSGPTSAALGGVIASNDTTVSVMASTIQNNGISVIASAAPVIQGVGFATIGGSLSISGSTLFNNGSVFTNGFFHPGATISLRGSVVNGTRYPGSFTLGDKGFTPDS